MSLYIPQMTDTPGVTIPGLADNFTLLAGSRSVESGSNENGEYWRWESGLQICTFYGGNVSLEVDPVLPQGENRRFEIPFPASFSSATNLAGSVEGTLTTSTGGIRTGILDMYSMIASEGYWDIIAFNLDNMSVSQIRRLRLIAIGRWKE